MSSRAVYSCYVTDPGSALESLRALGLLSNGKNSGLRRTYDVFTTVDENNNVVKLGIYNAKINDIIGHLIFIRNEVACKNSPVYIYVDSISNLRDHVNHQLQIDGNNGSAVADVSVFTGNGSSNTLVHIDIGQCDVCFLEEGKDASDIALISEWNVHQKSKRTANLLDSSNNGKLNSPVPTREAVIEAAEAYYQNMKATSNAPSSSAVESKSESVEPQRKPSLAKLSNKDPNLMSDEEFRPYWGRRIPSLYFSLLNRNGVYRNITCNSPAPIPFRNENFDGKVLLMINTKHKSLIDTEYESLGADLYENRFDGTKYTFDIQVQGKFLKIPTGHIYFGAESSEKMNLGWLTQRGVAQVFSIAKRFNAHVSCAIGDDEELPHTTAPLWSTLDFLIVTPGKGVDRSKFSEVTITDKPPPLGSTLNEDPAKKKARRSNFEFTVPIDLESTYTFSFMSTQLECISWRACNIPLINSMSLSSFFDKADVRFTCYSIPYGTKESNAGKFNGNYLPEKHIFKKIDYLLNLKVQHVSNHPEYLDQKHVGLDSVPAMIVPTEDSNSTSENDNIANDEGSDGEDDFVDVPPVSDDGSPSSNSMVKMGGGAPDSGSGHHSAFIRRPSGRRSFLFNNDDVEDYSRYYGRRIPSLYMSLLHKNSYVGITANSPAAIPFSNEYMEGRVLFMINTNHKSNRNDPMHTLGPDLYESRFEGTKFTYDIQVQAKFLKKPEGPIFFGFETTKKMELGKFTSTKAFYDALLKVAYNFNKNIHFSLGDKDNKELPHVVAPLWQAVDALIITPGPNTDESKFTNVTITKTPPAFGGIFVEDPQLKILRMKDLNFQVPIDLDTIYSCSFKSTQLELITWKWNHVPIFGKIDLHQFFDDADIRFCCYAVPQEGRVKENWHDGESIYNNKYLPKYHFQSNLIKLLSLEIRHKSNQKDTTDPPCGLNKSPSLISNIRRK